MNRFIVLIISFGSVLGLRGPSTFAAPAPTADTQRAAALVEKLDDQEYQIRTDSERQLRRLGIHAIPALENAVHHDSPEIAVRARKLLADARHRLLTELDVQLDVKPDRVAWNEPFELTVTFKNPTAYDMALPLVPQTSPAPNPAAAQVGAMLDVADDLDVIAPDGRELELHLIDIKEDPAVDDQVTLRLQDTQDVLLRAGQTHTHTIPNFNRGWARYRLLHTGIYQIQYRLNVEVPTFDSDSQTRIEVISNTTNVTVTRDAPVDVEDTGVKLRADLTYRDDQLVLTLTNTYDQPVVLHTRTGQSLARFASVRWRVQVDETKRVVTEPAPADNRTGNRTNADAFLTLPPAAKHVILQKPLAELWAMPELRHIVPGEFVQITAVYLNFYSRSTLLTKPFPAMPPEKLRQEVRAIPLFVYTGSAVSNVMTLKKKKRIPTNSN